MLRLLRIRDFAVIEALEVEFDGGLSVITGETGAGKSILVRALNLALGGRASADVVRSGARAAEVEAVFEVLPGSRAHDWLVAQEMVDPGDGTLRPQDMVIRRTVSSSGRSRAFVNGRVTTLAQVAEVTTGLADVSSQHEHHSLMQASAHLEYLDAFGELGALRREVGEAHRQLSDADAQLRAFSEDSQAERADLYRYQVQEIEASELHAVDEAELAHRVKRLESADELKRLALEVDDGLYSGDGSVGERLGHWVARLRQGSTLDGTLATLAETLEGARDQVEEVGRDVGRYARGVESDPEALSAAQEQLHQLRRILRKYGGTRERALAHLGEIQRKLGTLDHAEQRRDELQKCFETALRQAEASAARLSRARHDAADRLGTAIARELASLGMGRAEVRVDVSPLSLRNGETRAEDRGATVDRGGGELSVNGARFGPRGTDHVEFLISPNPGEAPRPLGRIASGGELSRSLLAVKRVLAGLRPAGLYVFDEVDSGVGGAVAEVIGRKIRDIAQHHQVLCITHLPQIAVFAHTHLVATKDQGERRTRTVFERLDERARKTEIARMLGGIRVTQATREAATQMLNEARRAP